MDVLLYSTTSQGNSIGWHGSTTEIKYTAAEMRDPHDLSYIYLTCEGIVRERKEERSNGGKRKEWTGSRDNTVSITLGVTPLRVSAI